MPRSSVRWFCLATVLLLGVTASWAQDRRDYAAYYIDKYGEVAAGEDAQVQRAENVFQRVLAAADKKANRFPRLVVLRTWGEPWALSLPDGSVVVTLGALRVCYDEIDELGGDARIAFVFGHELAHLAKDDFWHRPAFDAVTKHVQGDAAADDLKRHLRVSNDDVRTKELQADSLGIIYMAMAGYEPSTILPATGDSFLDHWALEVRGYAEHDAASSTHHTPKRRSDFLRAQLERVIDHLDYFHIGVRFYQIGLYEEALEFLSEFRREYPGREVYNNVGLAHYQLAMEALAVCDAGGAFAFKPSLAVDSSTTGHGTALRASWEGPTQGGHCEAYRREFQDQLQRAIRNLRVATERDPFYLPARLNLSSALIMAGNHAEALAVVDAALASYPGSSAAKNNKAIALYLFGKENHIEATPRVLGLLTPSAADAHGAGDLLYNRAAVLEDLGRGEEAAEAWRSYLGAAGNDLYAANARRKLGAAPAPQMSPRLAPMPESPLALGRLEDQGALKDLAPESRHFTLGTLSGQIHKGDSVRVLVIDSRVELVEEKLTSALNPNRFRRVHGSPQRVLTGPQGQTWVYGSYVADVQGGEIRRLVHF